MRRERRADNVRKMARTTPGVEVLIDDLVLYGCRAADRYVIGDALTQELGRLLDTPGSRLAFAEPANVTDLNAGRISISEDAQPASIGARLGRVVYSSLHRSVGGNR
jgi:hypothetical protein